MKTKFFFAVSWIAISYVGLTATAMADESEDLAKQLTNPVANLISVPFQGNYNTHINSKNSGHQTYVNIQPVIPIELTKEWNLILRTILPVINQVNIGPGTGRQVGLGDTLQSFFLSPAAPTASGIIWGAGPAVQIPTGTQTLLGSGKLDLGPTIVILKMTGPWTIGILANQLWSVAGNGSRLSTSSAYAQPFLAYTTSTAWTYTINSESTYNWNARTLSAPINADISKLITIHKQPISIGGGLRYWVTSPASGPKDFGARFVVTFLFPK